MVQVMQVQPEIWEGKTSESNSERSLSATSTWPGWGLSAWIATTQQLESIITIYNSFVSAMHVSNEYGMPRGHN